jgi:hypothetical protein
MSDNVPIPDGFLREWCDTFAQGSEMPPEGYLATGLVSLAAIVGPALYIRFSLTSRERCNLWVVNTGRSAMARKTTGLSAARWAVEQAGQTLGDQIRWYPASRISDAQIAVDLDVVGTDTAALVEDEKEAAKAAKRKAEAVEPRRRPTPVSWLMALNELAPLWGEGKSEWQQATQAFLLQLFDGHLSSSTRQTKVIAQETFVSAIGNIPPAELDERTTIGMLRSGYAGRWLFLEGPGPVTPISFPGLNGSDSLRWMAAKVEALAQMAAWATRGVEVRPLWTPEALACQDEWYCRWFYEVNGNPDPRLGDASARHELWSRLQATALKLATLVAVSRQVGRVSTLAEVRVEPDDAAWAQARAEASITILMEVIDRTGGGSISTIGRIEHRAVTALRRRDALGEPSAVNVRVLCDAIKGRDSRREVLQALDSLVGSGQLGMDERPNARGRPSRFVWLTPIEGQPGY